MKVAKEKVWVDAKGNLVADGDDAATVLVAAKGQNVADSQVEQYKNADKFFKDAIFDGDGKQVGDAPKPKNREDDKPDLHKRAHK